MVVDTSLGAVGCFDGRTKGARSFFDGILLTAAEDED